MKGTKARTVNTLGMFDLFKGIGMATVIFVHTAESYSIDLGGGLSVTSFLLFIYREALMSAFYIASGYGFRKRSVGKCVQQQLRASCRPSCTRRWLRRGCICFCTTTSSARGRWPSPKARRSWRAFCWGCPHTSDYFRDEHLLLRAHVVPADHGRRLDHPGHPVQTPFPSGTYPARWPSRPSWAGAPALCGSCPSACPRA